MDTKEETNQEQFDAEIYINKRLLHEQEYYDNRVGDYAKAKTQKEAKQLLVKRTEGILYYDIASTLQFSQKTSGDFGGSNEENKIDNQKQNQQ